MTKGRRVSLALFSLRSWTRIPQHALNELQEAGFYPPRSVNFAQAYLAILDPGTEEPQPLLETPPLLEELPEKLQLPSPEQEAILFD